MNFDRILPRTAPFIISLLVFGAGLSCSTVNQIPNQSKYYKRDLTVLVNGVACPGVCVVKQAPKYHFELKTDLRIDYLSFETCHRKVSLEDQDNDWSYDYVPTSLELDCPVEIVTLDKKKGKNAYALVTYSSAEYTHPASLICDGVTSQPVGSDICQSKNSLIQQVSFNEPMVVHPPEGCPLKDVGNNTYQIGLARGPCVYVFGSKSGFFRLNTFGSDDYVLKEL